MDLALDTNDIREGIQRSLADGLPDEVMAVVKKQMDNVWCDLADRIDWMVKDDMSAILAEYVKDRAQSSVEAIIKGSDDEMRFYLSARPGYWNGRDTEHHVIHGTLFETGALELRKRFVAAHADLLKNERILDLEAQVTSLVKQINAKDAEIARLREHLA